SATLRWTPIPPTPARSAWWTPPAASRSSPPSSSAPAVERSYAALSGPHPRAFFVAGCRRMPRVNAMPGPNLLCLDCDSTLSAIEGVDELARLRGPACLARVEAMTNDAMEGRLPVEEVFGRRLDLIRPTRAE